MCNYSLSHSIDTVQKRVMNNSWEHYKFWLPKEKQDKLSLIFDDCQYQATSWILSVLNLFIKLFPKLTQLNLSLKLVLNLPSYTLLKYLLESSTTSASELSVKVLLSSLLLLLRWCFYPKLFFVMKTGYYEPAPLAGLAFDT